MWFIKIWNRSELSRKEPKTRQFYAGSLVSDYRNIKSSFSYPKSGIADISSIYCSKIFSSSNLSPYDPMCAFAGILIVPLKKGEINSIQFSRFLMCCRASRSNFTGFRRYSKDTFLLLIKNLSSSSISDSSELTEKACFSF